MRICFVVSQFEKLGVEYLSACLKAAGHDVRLAYDPRLFSDSFNVNRTLAGWFNLERRVVQEAVDQRADLYALSLASADWAWAKRMTSALKERTRKPVVGGGVHVSAATNQVLLHPSVDFAMTGECEEAMVDLVNALESGRDVSALPNASLRRDGRIIRNPNRPLLEDLDQLPFPDKQIYYDVSGHHNYGYNIMPSRGCAKACSYCYNSWYWNTFPNKHRRVRHRSVENVLEELDRAVSLFRIGFVRFLDDDFCYNRDWFLEFARLYPKHIGLPYRIFVDADSCTEEVVRKLEESGCYEVEMGVQTIEHDTRTKVFNRPQVEGQCRRVIEAFSRTRVTCCVDNIIGYPGQTVQHMQTLLEFYNQVRPDRVQNLWLRYWPGCSIVDIARERGFLKDDECARIAAEPTDLSCVKGGMQFRHEGWVDRAVGLLYLGIHMPRWFNRFWIRNRKFLWFPPIPGFGVYSFFSALMTRYNMYGVRFRRRYAKYLLYKLLLPLRELSERLFFGGRSPLVSPPPSRERRLMLQPTGSLPETSSETGT